MKKLIVFVGRAANSGLGLYSSWIFIINSCSGTFERDLLKNFCFFMPDKSKLCLQRKSNFLYVFDNSFLQFLIFFVLYCLQFSFVCMTSIYYSQFQLSTLRAIDEHIQSLQFLSNACNDFEYFLLGNCH